MKTNLLKWIVLLSMIAPLAANAMSIIYDVDRAFGGGSVMGTITTDGTQGSLQDANIEAFDLVLDDGVEMFTITLGDAQVIGGLSADAAGLNIDWGSAEVLFGTRITDNENWSWRLDYQFESIVHVLESGGQHDSVNRARTGTEQIAIARVTSLPEPGTLGLALIGLAGLGFARKGKQRQSAAV